MIFRGGSFFAILILAAPASAAAPDSAKPLDMSTRLGRAKTFIDELTTPIDNGGITRDPDDMHKVQFRNFRPFSNFSNFRPFNNFNNFRPFQNFQNFRPFQNFNNVRPFSNWNNQAAIMQQQRAAEAARQRQMEQQRVEQQRATEMARQRQIEQQRAEQQRAAEMARQRQIEQQRAEQQRAAEMARQRQIEQQRAEQQRAAEAARKAQAEAQQRAQAEATKRAQDEAARKSQAEAQQRAQAEAAKRAQSPGGSVAGISQPQNANPSSRGGAGNQEIATSRGAPTSPTREQIARTALTASAANSVTPELAQKSAEMAKKALGSVPTVLDKGSFGADVLALRNKFSEPFKDITRTVVNKLPLGTLNQTQQTLKLEALGKWTGFAGGSLEAGMALRDGRKVDAAFAGGTAVGAFVPGLSGGSTISKGYWESGALFVKGDYVMGTLTGVAATGRAAAGGLGFIYAGGAGCIAGGPAGCVAGAAKGVDIGVGAYDLTAGAASFIDVSDTQIFRWATDGYTGRAQQEQRLKDLDQQYQVWLKNKPRR
jgi:hypothetical protein